MSYGNALDYAVARFDLYLVASAAFHLRAHVLNVAALFVAYRTSLCLLRLGEYGQWLACGLVIQKLHGLARDRSGKSSAAFGAFV